MGYEWDWVAGEAECRGAISLDPLDATAHDYYAECLTATRQHAEALVEIHKAQEIEPLSLIINRDVGCHLYMARNFTAAIQQLEQTLELDPRFALALWTLGLAYGAAGAHDRAAESLQQAVTLSPDQLPMQAALAHALALPGESRRARALLDELRRLASGRYVSSYDLALVWVSLKENDEALRGLERACEERCWELAYLAVEPRFDPLRSDARFQKLLSRLRLRPSKLSGGTRTSTYDPVRGSVRSRRNSTAM